LISLIIGKKIKDLKLLPTEFRDSINERTLTVYRIDFSAKVKMEDGAYMNVIIEIQKAKFSTDIMRFRKYLGGQYADSNNTYLDKDGSNKPYPILSIYFLGHNLKNIDQAIIQVERTYRDRVTQKPIGKKDEFIESLTHDSYIIQIQKLKKKSKSKIEQVLSVFDQAKGVNHFLEIDETKYPKEYQEVIRRLIKAASEPKVRNTMDIEDEIILDLENLERRAETALEEKEKALKQKEEERRQKEEALKREEEERRQKEEERRQKEEERRQKEEALKEIAKLKAMIEAKKK
jgi:hypothetical protein